MFQIRKGDLVLPYGDIEIPYYSRKPFIVGDNPYSAKAIESGKWRRRDGPGLIVCEPTTTWDSCMLILPGIGPVWITYPSYSVLTLAKVNVQVLAQLRAKSIINILP